MEKTEDKKTVKVKTSDAVAVYNILRKLNIARLKKEDAFVVLRAANRLKPAASAFEEFVKDAQERLKPEGWDERSQKFDSLPDAEKAEFNKAASAYQKDVEECVKTELEKEIEIETALLGEEGLADIIASNDKLNVEAIMLIEDTIGNRNL